MLVSFGHRFNKNNCTAIGSGESLGTPGRVPEAMPGTESHQTGGGQRAEMVLGKQWMGIQFRKKVEELNSKSKYSQSI